MKDKKTWARHVSRKPSILWRCCIALLMLLLAQNGWAGTFTTTVDEKNATHGKIYIKAEGGDIDYFNSEGCPNDICKNRFHTISFFDNVSG